MRFMLCALLAAWLGRGLDAQAPRGDLIERTLAIVGTQVITLSDARAAIRLGLIEAGGEADPVSVTQLLVDRELVLREVQRYAPPAPSEGAVDAGMEEIRTRLPGADELSRVLDEAGFTESRLRAWVRDDLRVVAYLAQRFASASTPTDTEVTAAFAQQRADFERSGTTFEQAAPTLRERLVASRRRELISDWLSDLRRRTAVVILPQ
ncbi:MAG: hypothetical protein EXQ50_00445 [Acidobacteria bacterium]|nr:hypothetical protein [Acidobacteriota bacterium]MSO60556.1 hypothetical protein [Acidobacteriota bacterium]